MKQIMTLAAAALSAVTMMGAASTAQAAVTFIGGAFPCSLTDVSGATACAGLYSGNGIAGTPNAADNQQDAFTHLGLSGTPTIIDSYEDPGPSDNSGVIDFGQLLFGKTVISVHWGKGNGANSPADVAGGSSGMYVLNFLAPTSTITAAFGDTFSNARLFSTEVYTPCTSNCGGGGGSGGAVPEPATWALMIIGFGSVGAVMRRRRTLTA